MLKHRNYWRISQNMTEICGDIMRNSCKIFNSITKGFHVIANSRRVLFMENLNSCKYARRNSVPIRWIPFAHLEVPSRTTYIIQDFSFQTFSYRHSRQKCLCNYSRLSDLEACRANSTNSKIIKLSSNFSMQKHLFFSRFK